jgi:hypothetical protein
MNLVGLPLNTPIINIYRGTRDGFTQSAFLAGVNGINGTYTIIKTNNGYIFGGFTKINWGLDIGWVGDSSAFIFSLINPSNYPCIIYQKNNASNYTVFTSTASATSTGFLMGKGPDLYAAQSSNSNSNSFGNLVTFQVPSNYTSVGSTFLTGSANFQSAEIEVFISNSI